MINVKMIDCWRRYEGGSVFSFFPAWEAFVGVLTPPCKYGLFGLLLPIPRPSVDV